MSISYALIVTTLCSILLAFFPRLLSVDGTAIPKKKIFLNTFFVYVFLYILAPTPLLLPICYLLSFALTAMICLMIYFQITNYLVKRSPSLKIKFDNIDRMNGFDFEEFVAEILAAKGYRDVTVTKKTGDFGVDATCLPISPKDKRKIAIQIKRYNSPVSVGAVQEIVAGAAIYKADLKIVITNSTFTTNAKILAESNDCTLVDRITLQNWVYEVDQKAAKPIKPQRLKLKKETVAPPLLVQPLDIQEEGLQDQELSELYLESEIDDLLLTDQTKHLSTESIMSIQAPVDETINTKKITETEIKEDDKTNKEDSNTNIENQKGSSAELNNITKDETQETTKIVEQKKLETLDLKDNNKIADVKKHTPSKAQDEDSDIELDSSDLEEEEMPIFEENEEELSIDDELDGEAQDIDEFNVPDL